MKKKDIIFGLHAILEALKTGEPIGKIWIKTPTTHTLHKKIIAQAEQRAIPVSKVPLIKLTQMTSQRHQGVVALLSPVAFASLPTVIQAAFEKGETPLIVMLNRVEDTRNLGAIIRTAAATAVHAVVIPTKETAPIDGVTMKVSAGTLRQVPICRVAELGGTINYLQQSGIQILACTEKARKTYYTADFRLPTALLLGGEAKGIATHYLDMSNQHIQIPMAQHVNSLNLAVATGIILYEAVRQRS